MFFKRKKAKPKQIYRGRIDHKVTKLLFNCKGMAFTVEKIAEFTNMNENTVRSMLRRLIQDGYIKHTKPFFHWK